jgi:hypothetical protein
VDLVILNRQTGTRPVVVHAHGVLVHKPAWPKIRAALFALPPSAVGPVADLTLLTCNNGHEAMGLFERSAERLGVPYLVRGAGIVPWVNSRDKPRVIRDALREIDTEFVLYADSRDAVLLADPTAARDRFAGMDGCDLLFSADRINWPALEPFRQFERGLPGAADSEFRYLNGGVWIGRTAYCREVFTRACETAPLAEAPDSEQGILKALLPDLYPRARLDYRCEIFQNIGFVLNDIFDVEPTTTTSSGGASST